MLLGKIKEFHNKTMEAYRMEEEERMEDWKKLVLRLHEEAGFLFYFDELLVEDEQERLLCVRGDYVKGHPDMKSPIYLYDGQGSYLGLALILSDPEEKEEQRRGFLTPHRNEFLLKLLTYRGRKVKDFSMAALSQALNDMDRSLSLITDIRKEESGSERLTGK